MYLEVGNSHILKENRSLKLMIVDVHTGLGSEETEPFWFLFQKTHQHRPQVAFPKKS